MIFMKKEGDKMDQGDKDYYLRFIMSELTSVVVYDKDIRKELEANKKVNYTVGITGPNDLKLTGTIIIKEEE